MLLLRPTTFLFNLLDGIWNPPDLDESGAESAGLEGGGECDSACVSLSVCCCAFIRVCVCVSPRQQWVVSNTLWWGSKPRPVAETSRWLHWGMPTVPDWLIQWPIDRLLDWLFVWLIWLLLVPQRWVFLLFWGAVRITANWREHRKMFWWISSDWLSVAPQQILMAFYSLVGGRAGGIDEVFVERTCWRAGWCRQHLRCISICIYWPLTEERLFTKKSMHHFIVSTDPVSYVCKGISWHLSSALRALLLIGESFSAHSAFKPTALLALTLHLSAVFLWKLLQWCCV